MGALHVLCEIFRVTYTHVASSYSKGDFYKMYELKQETLISSVSDKDKKRSSKKICRTSFFYLEIKS